MFRVKGSRDIISIREFSVDDIGVFLEKACDIKNNPGEYSSFLEGKSLARLFYEPSRRTNESFRLAMERLGGEANIGFTTPKGTSVEKGESIRSNIRMCEQYGATCIVIRHPRDGSARYAADVTELPVINGGDGYNEHPTQNLMDLFTIHEKQGRLDNLKILFFNDLKYGRTTRLVYPLSKFPKNRFYFLSHRNVRMPENVKHYLNANAVKWEESLNPRDFPDILSEVDVAYGSRTQNERFPKTPEGQEMLYDVMDYVVLSKKTLKAAKPNKNLMIMHPLPVDEEHPCLQIEELEDEPFAYWNQQAGNGIPARQAMLYLIHAD
jgi:aspartate carbamoyltransferase catalytic subunit